MMNKTGNLNAKLQIAGVFLLIAAIVGLALAIS